MMPRRGASVVLSMAAPIPPEKILAAAKTFEALGRILTPAGRAACTAGTQGMAACRRCGECPTSRATQADAGRSWPPPDAVITYGEIAL